MPVAQIEITSRGERRVARGFRNIDKSVAQVGRTSERVTRNMRAGWSKVGATVKGMGAILGGAAIAAGGKKVLDFRQKLGELQAKMKMSTKDAEAMGDQVLQVGKAHNIAKDDVLGALKVFQDFGGYTSEGRRVLDQLGVRAKAATVPIKDLARISAALVDAKMSPENTIKAIDQMIAHADEGKVSMEDLGRVLPGVASNAALMGERFKGLEGVKRVSQLMQIAGTASAGNAEEARTSIKNMFNDLTKNSKKLEEIGINVFDEKGMRDIDTLMSEIMAKTGGKIQGKRGLSAFFGMESMNIAGTYASAFDKKTGKFGGGVAKISGAKGSRESTEESYNLRMQGVAKEAEDVGRAWRELEAALMKSGGELIKWVNENRGKAAAVAVAGVAAVKLGPSILKGLFGMMSKGKAGGGVAGALGGAMGVQPVFVVNLPGANIGQAAGFFGEGGGALGKTAGPAGKVASKFGAVAKAAGPLALALGAGVAAGMALDELTDASGKLSTLFAGSQKERAARARASNMASGATAAQRRQQSMSSALSLARIAGKGRTSVGVRGADGKMQQLQLTQGAVMKYLEAQAKGGGMKQENWELVASSLAKAIKGMPIEVKPADGLDKVSAQKGRGGKQ